MSDQPSSSNGSGVSRDGETERRSNPETPGGDESPPSADDRGSEGRSVSETNRQPPEHALPPPPLIQPPPSNTHARFDHKVPHEYMYTIVGKRPACRHLRSLNLDRSLNASHLTIDITTRET